MNDLKRKFLNFFHNLSFFLKRYWPFLAFFLISVTFFYPVWLQNKIPLPADALVTAHVPWTELKWEEYPAGIPVKNQEITDSFSQFYPWRSVVGEFWREGKIPLWNPYMFSGTPFLATWHSAALYPLNILYIFFSDLNAWTNLLFLQILLSGIFMYLFLRNIKLTKAASFLGAISFSFSGYMIAWFEFATGPHAGLWLPLLLLFEFKLINTNKKIWFVPIPFILFFIYTAGDFQVPFYITLIFLSFGFFLISRKKDKFLVSIKLITSFIFGILLSLPQLLPTIELFKESVRLNDPYIKEYFYGLMHWEKIVNFIWPDFFGNVVTGNYWGKFGYHEYLSFVGVVPLVFAISSVFQKKDRFEIFFWWSLFISLLFLFPTPLAHLPFILKIPGLGTSSASRIIFLVDFLIATLSAYGFSKWQRKNIVLSKTIVGYFLAVSGVALGISVSLYFMNKAQINNLPRVYTNLKVALKNMTPSTLVLTALAVLVLARNKLLKIFKTKLVIAAILLVSIVELLWFGWKNTPFSPKKFVFPQTKIIEFLETQEKPFRIAGGIPLNLFMYNRLGSAEGYDPIYPYLNSEWFSLVNSSSLDALSGRYGQIHNFNSPLLDYANIKFIVEYKKDKFGGISEKGEFSNGVASPKYKEIFQEGRIKVFENTTVLPKIWLGTTYQVEAKKEAISKLLLDPTTREKKLIVLEEHPDIEIAQKDIGYSVDNIRESFNMISFDVATTDPSLVFLSETYYPGWSAYVDGKRADIIRSNYIFQSIAIPEGVHNIAFKYEPKSFRIGVLLSLVTLIFLAVYTFKYAKK
ncbi:hypothetical protein A3F01_01915 [Candidatus Woesebacteria bacterium RIFCSPHIGHO2_12_FULL_38_11]|nr:MAG: hypothetical protein A3F01_01915 [Candidatus Woesebacteria bacterium RIFCSPHIGHO2_12_FULL_38_11]